MSEGRDLGQKRPVKAEREHWMIGEEVVMGRLKAESFAESPENVHCLLERRWILLSVQSTIIL